MAKAYPHFVSSILRYTVQMAEYGSQGGLQFPFQMNDSSYCLGYMREYI